MARLAQPIISADETRCATSTSSAAFAHISTSCVRPMRPMAASSHTLLIDQVMTSDMPSTHQSWRLIWAGAPGKRWQRASKRPYNGISSVLIGGNHFERNLLPPYCKKRLPEDGVDCAPLCYW